jgi:hypothetical protein
MWAVQLAERGDRDDVRRHGGEGLVDGDEGIRLQPGDR